MPPQRKTARGGVPPLTLTSLFTPVVMGALAPNAPAAIKGAKAADRKVKEAASDVYAKVKMLKERVVSKGDKDAEADAPPAKKSAAAKKASSAKKAPSSSSAKKAKKASSSGGSSCSRAASASSYSGGMTGSMPGAFSVMPSGYPDPAYSEPLSPDMMGGYGYVPPGSRAGRGGKAMATKARRASALGGGSGDYFVHRAGPVEGIEGGAKGMRGYEYSATGKRSSSYGKVRRVVGGDVFVADFSPAAFESNIDPAVEAEMLQSYAEGGKPRKKAAAPKKKKAAAAPKKKKAAKA
jgi:hypothetical protein